MRFISLLIVCVPFSLVACLAPTEPTEGDERVADVELEAKSVIQCGGIAGLECPDNLVCVDDPKDSCDPSNGGADCPGTCKRPKGGGSGDGGSKSCNTKGKKGGKVYIGESPEQCASIKFVCEAGTQYFADNCGCGCEPISGEPCGDVTCGDGLVCCNASCGICTEPGGVCIQLACI